MTYKNVKIETTTDLTPVTKSNESFSIYTGSYSNDYVAYSKDGKFKFYKLYFYATTNSSTNGYYKDITKSLKNGDVLVSEDNITIKFVKVTQAEPAISLAE